MDLGRATLFRPFSVLAHHNKESLSTAAARSSSLLVTLVSDRRILILESALKPTASVASVETGNALIS